MDVVWLLQLRRRKVTFVLQLQIAVSQFQSHPPSHSCYCFCLFWLSICLYRDFVTQHQNRACNKCGASSSHYIFIGQLSRQEVEGMVVLLLCGCQSGEGTYPSGFFASNKISYYPEEGRQSPAFFFMAAKQSGDFKSNHDVLVTQPSISTAL